MYILFVGLYAYLFNFVVRNLLGYIYAVHGTFPIYVLVVQMTHTRALFLRVKCLSRSLFRPMLPGPRL